MTEDRIVTGLVVLYEELVRTITEHLPSTKGILEGQYSRMEQLFSEQRAGFQMDLLLGKGPRATTLRQMNEFMPDIDAELHIQANLPVQKKLANQDSLNKLLTLANHLLDELPSMTADRAAWLAATPLEELHGHFRGPSGECFPSDVVDGFYWIQNRNDYIFFNGNKQRPNVVRLRLSEQEILNIRENGVDLDIFVPIEGQWVSTRPFSSFGAFAPSYAGVTVCDYLDPDKSTAALIAWFKRIGFQTDTQWNMTSVYKHFEQKFFDLGGKVELAKGEYDTTPALFRAEREGTKDFSVFSAKAYRYHNHDKTAFGEQTVFTFARNRLCITLSKWENGPNVSYHLRGNTSYIEDRFDRLPIRVREQLMTWMEAIFKEHVTGMTGVVT